MKKAWLLNLEIDENNKLFIKKFLRDGSFNLILAYHDQNPDTVTVDFFTLEENMSLQIVRLSDFLGNSYDVAILKKSDDPHLFQIHYNLKNKAGLYNLINLIGATGWQLET